MSEFSFNFWSFWQLIPLMCLFPSPRLSSLPSQMPKASTAHCCITKHSNLCSVLPTAAVLWQLFKFQESTLERTKPARDTYNICYFIPHFKAMLLALHKTSLAFRVSCTGLLTPAFYTLGNYFTLEWILPFLKIWQYKLPSVKLRYEFTAHCAHCVPL